MYLFVFAAGAMALFCIAAAIRRPHPASLLAVVLWAAYAVYEYHIANGTLCDSDCNIRVDLAFFLPLLGAATYLGLQEDPRPISVAILFAVCLGLLALIAGAFGYMVVAAAAGAAALIAIGLGVRSIFRRRQGG